MRYRVGRGRRGTGERPTSVRRSSATPNSHLSDVGIHCMPETGVRPWVVGVSAWFGDGVDVGGDDDHPERGR